MEGSIPIREMFLPRGKFDFLDGNGLTQCLSQPKHASFQLERHPGAGELYDKLGLVEVPADVIWPRAC